MWVDYRGSLSIVYNDGEISSLYNTLLTTLKTKELRIKIITGFYSYPLRNAVVIHSWQNLWMQSLVVMVFCSISRQIGHFSSAASVCWPTTRVVESVTSS